MSYPPPGGGFPGAQGAFPGGFPQPAVQPPSSHPNSFPQQQQQYPGAPSVVPTSAPVKHVGGPPGAFPQANGHPLPQNGHAHNQQQPNGAAPQPGYPGAPSSYTPSAFPGQQPQVNGQHLYQANGQPPQAFPATAKPEISTGRAPFNALTAQQPSQGFPGASSAPPGVPQTQESSGGQSVAAQHPQAFSGQQTPAVPQSSGPASGIDRSQGQQGAQDMLGPGAGYPRGPLPPFPGAQQPGGYSGVPGGPPGGPVGYPGGPQPPFSGAQKPGFPAAQAAGASFPGSQQPNYPGAHQSSYPGALPGGPPTAPGSFQRGPQPPFPGAPQPGYPAGAPTSGPPGTVTQQPQFPGAQQPSFPTPPSGMPGGPQPSFPGAQQPGYPTPGGMPGAPASYPGAPTGYPGAAQKQRLDPNLMPSAVQVMEDDQVRAGIFPTGFPHAEYPPLVSTNFFAQDQGNCNPKFMRSSLYVAPATSDLLKSSQIPFVIAVSPFAALSPNERPPPIIDLGPMGPVRCQRCKAYMCPFMEFQDGGRRFKCPFCLASTAVEEGYFAHLDHTGRRTDIQHRPEQYMGTYEFVATKPYCKNGVPPKEPAFLFMLDVSYNAMHNGLVDVFCRNLEKILENLPKELGVPTSLIHIGFATYDQTIHFYDLSAAGAPRMLVVGDMSDVFVPLVDGLLQPYEIAKPTLTELLTKIPSLFAQSRVTETCLGPVVQAGLDALKSADRSGKLFVFNTSLPVFEAPGKLKNRDDRKLLGTEKEKTILNPQVDFYTKLGEECVKAGCAVDLFLFPNSYTDVATLGQLTAVTGGSLFKYQYFEAAKDSERFLRDLYQDVGRQIAFDVMVRVRTSTGIRPTEFLGSFFMDNSTDLQMAAIDQEKAFFSEVKHDDKLAEGSAFIQAAVLFTSVSGQRRLRIVNMALPVSSDYSSLYRLADQDTLVAYLLKQSVRVAREKGIKEVKEGLAARCAQILATYREKCSEQAPLGQLILPESLKLLPLFVNSILKNDAISGGSEMTVDDKSWMQEQIRGMRVENALPLVYPRVYAVSDLSTQDGDTEAVPLKQIRASSEYMESEKAYLVDNGQILFLWIGLGVGDEWARDVFGATSVATIDTEIHRIPEKDNARSRGLRRAVAQIEAGRCRKLFLIREKDPLEPWMKKFLVEDKSGNSISYVDFLCHVHREIRNILS